MTGPLVPFRFEYRTEEAPLQSPAATLSSLGSWHPCPALIAPLTADRSQVLAAAPKGLQYKVPCSTVQSGANRWARNAASQRGHRVLRAGDAEGGAALRR